jgi:hypothetical protein
VGSLLHARHTAELDRRLAVWEPLIGREATRTALQALWLGRRGYLILLSSIAFDVVLELVGAPVSFVLVGLVGWPVAIWYTARYLSLLSKAQQQAARVAGVSDSARPPVRSVVAFERWQRTSQFSRSRDIYHG